MNAFVAAAADDTEVTCTHQRWTKQGGGAFDVELADTSGEAAVIWQVEEWVLHANEATQQTVNPGDTNMHKTSVAHANPTPVKLKKAIVRTDGAGLKITNWCRTNRPGLPWFSTAPEDATASLEEPSPTTLVQGGRHVSLGAFVAYTELAKKESTKMMAEQEGQITKLNEARCEMKDAMTEMAKANANMMAAIGATGKQVTELTGRVDDISVKTDRNEKKTDRIIAALEKAGIVFPPDALRLRLRPRLRLRQRVAEPSRLCKTCGWRWRAAVGAAAARSDRVAEWGGR